MYRASVLQLLAQRKGIAPPGTKPAAPAQQQQQQQRARLEELPSDAPQQAPDGR
jgi:hypothetical protein